MTRILYWNIQKFSAPKVTGKNFTATNLATNRLNYIKQVIAPGKLPRRPPDMIIIVEVNADHPAEVRELGAVLPSDSPPASGLLTLLTEIRVRLGATWCLVPPVPTGEGGKCEAVAVLYDSDSLIFTGPYVYATDKTSKRRPVDKAMPANAANLGNLATYEPAWGQYLPKDRNRSWLAPDGTTKVNEWQAAAQWEYGRLLFPNAPDRRPIYTRMQEVDGNRTIKVFTIHTTPPPTAPDAVRRLRLIPEVGTVRNDEVAVVVGDFNVDSFQGDPAWPNRDLDHTHHPYEALVTAPARGGLGYQMLINPCPPGTFHQDADRKPYCLTYLLPNIIKPDQPDERKIATPYNATGLAAPDPTHNVYPRFGYMGSYSTQAGTYADIGAFDNAFVRYGPNLNPVAHHTTIVNTVVGKPYNRALPPLPPGVTADLTAGYQEPSWLLQGIPQPAGINPNADTNDFNNYENYGLIRSVSDHLAIVFDV